MLSPFFERSLSSSDEEIDELIYETVPHIGCHSAQLMQSHIETSGRECRRRNMGDIARHDREREIGHNQLWNDYFAENPVYNERQFRRRFRMRKQLFLRIVEAMQNNRYFQQKPDAVGRMGLSGLQKCTAAIRMLSYVISVDVFYRSPVFNDVLNGRVPHVTFVVNGHQYDMSYYLIDGIYPPCATFIQSINLPQTNKEKLFAQVQETTRKDVERAFGVLHSRFAVIRRPSLAWNQQILGNIIKACIIMHNMIVENERDTYEHYTDPSDFIQEDRSSGSRRADFDEPFEFSAERIVDINTYLTNRDRVRDRKKKNLIEHIWLQFGHEDN